jgi:hypothetical protein
MVKLIKIAKELRENIPTTSNSNFFLLEIKLVERAHDLTKEFNPKMDTNTKIGFLTFQPINKVINFQIFSISTQSKIK